MRQIFLILGLLLPASTTWAVAPVCLYQDVLSGPAVSAFSSSYGENSAGVYIDLYGTNFGASSAGVTVTVNGVSATIISFGPDNTGDRQKIGIQVPASATGTGAIVLTTSGGSCQYSTATISNVAVTSGVGTFAYTGAQLLTGQLLFMQGLTSTSGLQINGYYVEVLASSLSSSIFKANIPQASNQTSTADTGTVSNGGFTVTTGNIWYVGSTVDNDSPGGGAAAFTCANFKAGTAGGGAGGNGSYASPWTLTDLVNTDTYATLELVSGGTSGYTNANNVPLAGTPGSGWEADIVTSGGQVVYIDPYLTLSYGTAYVIGNTYTLNEAGSSGDAVVQVVGYPTAAFNQNQHRTPYTYEQCMVNGDALVFLNGVNYAYGDGTAQHTSFNISLGGTSSAETIYEARPGATVQFGSLDGVAFGLRNTGLSHYTTVAGMTFEGSLINGQAMSLNSQVSAAGYIRAVGNTGLCPDCFGSVGGISAGQGASFEAAYSTFVSVLGNSISGMGCSLPANLASQGAPSGITNKQAHSYYMVGDDIEFGWNRVGLTSCAYNGVQINYGSDNHTVGYTDWAAHDNDIAGAVGACINMATVDPSRGYVLAYNNILNKCGWGTAADGVGTSYHGGISSPSYGASSTAGTQYWFNNTIYDASQILNSTSGTGTGCFIVSNGLQTNLTTNISNNLCGQPTYTNTGTIGQNVWVSNLNGTSGIAGSNDLFYSATTPANVTLGGLPAFGTSGMLNANPLFVTTADGPWTNYNLQASSPAIAAGSSSLYPATDFSGFTRTSSPAMGALEYQIPASGTQMSGKLTGSGAGRIN